MSNQHDLDIDEDLIPNDRTPGSSQRTRRELLRLGAIATGVVGTRAAMAGSPTDEEKTTSGRVIQKGNIRQSIMGWCFNPMPNLELAKHCKEIGLVAMEGIDSRFYDDVLKMGLAISLVGSHGFQDGPTDRANHANCVAKLREGIDLAVRVGCEKVITFTGMRVKGMSDAVAEANCVDLWKQVIGYAEEKGVTLCLEHLNSRDDSHPMKGHPGYFGDDVYRCVDLIRRVDSPQMKLLFDIYHVQIMHGDVIRRLRELSQWTAHYHTAGNPGRGELDDTQELNYPGIMKAILATGYKGFVAQEFIPTWADPIAALRHAAKTCDV